MTIEENYYSGAGAIQTPVPRLKIYFPVHGRSSTSMPMVSARGWVPVSGTGTAYQSVLSHWHTVTVTQAFLHSHTQDIRKPGFKMLTNPSPQFIRLFHKLLTQFPGEITCFKLSDTNDIRTRSQRDIQRKRKHALLPRKHAARSTRCCHWRPNAAVAEHYRSVPRRGITLSNKAIVQYINTKHFSVPNSLYFLLNTQRWTRRTAQIWSETFDKKKVFRWQIRTAMVLFALKTSNCSVFLHKHFSVPNSLYFLLNTQRSTRRTAQIWSETFDKKSASHFVICRALMECNGI